MQIDGLPLLTRDLQSGDDFALDNANGVTYRMQLLTQINNLIQQSTASGNGYFKSQDGTLICYFLKQVTNLECTKAYGALFESTTAVELGTWPTPFTNIPIVSVSVAGATLFPEAVNYTTNTNAGNVIFCRPTSATISFYVGVIGIGRWK